MPYFQDKRGRALLIRMSNNIFSQHVKKIVDKYNKCKYLNFQTSSINFIPNFQLNRNEIRSVANFFLHISLQKSKKKNKQEIIKGKQ